MKVYLDNAATTPIDPLVIEEMSRVMKEEYGNPSSIHSFGRTTRALIETSRKKVADLVGAAPGEIFFTSGGTEADNMALRCSIEDLEVKHIITSPIEHHAVLHTADMLQKRGAVKLSLVKLNKLGAVDLTHLEELLANTTEKTLVSLMHANNEVGTLLPLQDVAVLCKQHNAYFHSDTVQTMGHYNINFSKLNVDFATGAAHKFHGPKGVGFLYVNENVKVNPLIYGGSQERNMRAGTENVYGIVGLAKALEIACIEVNEHMQHVQGLKTYMIEQLESKLPGVEFNGDAKGNSLYTVLSVCLPQTDKAEMLLYSLDIMGIAASGGSACSSGSNLGSHVLRALGVDMNRPSVRFSFSRFTTREEIDYTVEKLASLF